jgi:hypothetical protein
MKSSPDLGEMTTSLDNELTLLRSEVLRALAKSRGYYVSARETSKWTRDLDDPSVWMIIEAHNSGFRGYVRRLMLGLPFFSSQKY